MLLDRRHHHPRATREIDGRGCDLRMSHHLGKSIYIATSFEHQCRERVTKRMGREINLGLFFYFGDKVIDTSNSDSSIKLSGSEEELRSLSKTFSLPQVIHKIARQTCRNRHYTIFSSFSAYDGYTHFFKTHIFHMQVRNFLLPQTCKDHESEDSYVSFFLIPVCIPEPLYTLDYYLSILTS